MQIGPYKLGNNLALAPMAGVTDLPFRLLCRRMGAGIAAGEMLTCDVRLWHTEKSRRRMDHSGEPEPRVVQIAGGDPEMMAEAARRNVDAGAQIIDINMGCPAKKVCNKAAGSALLTGATDSGGSCQGGRRTSDTEDPDRLESRPSQWTCGCAHG
jgi:tRNA-dihydrouridine synthase B